MSRSGYSDDLDNWALIKWRGAVASATKGARGQAMLRELLAALGAMPEKELVEDALVTAEGEYCALGVLGAARGLDMTKVDPEDRKAVAQLFGVAPALIAEIVFENDDDFGCYYPDNEVTAQSRKRNRWWRMRAWVEAQIIKEKVS